ncbi:MAG TPA: CHAD domain-containing protein [Abditibacteriaceae bacterium]|nr:CHAD domain-containing protein [Abditibacteriaceae bacterium]
MADIAREAGLAADRPVLSEASKLFAYLWGEVWNHASATLAGDADALHDMRVAIRRLRSALQNFEGTKEAPLVPARLRRELAEQRKSMTKLGDALGAVRDFDVLQGYLTDYSRRVLRRELAESAGLLALQEFMQKERAAAFAPMVKRIQKGLQPRGLQEQFARFALGLPAAHMPPLLLCGAALMILPQRTEEVLRHAAVLDDAQNVEEHHEFRKALRRLRYALEVLAPCCTAPVEPQIKILIQLQDYLGEMQDRSVLDIEAQRAFAPEPAAKSKPAKRKKRVEETSVVEPVENSLPEDVATFLRYGERRRRRLLTQARALWTKQQQLGFLQSLCS